VKKVYLHIGLPKCATTYLQKWVFPFVEGAHYLGRPYADDRIKKLENAFYKGKNIMCLDPCREFYGACIYSSEGFSNPLLLKTQSDYIERLKLFSERAFPGREVIFLVTTRPKNEWIQSFYKQFMQDWFYKDAEAMLRRHYDYFCLTVIPELKKTNRVVEIPISDLDSEMVNFFKYKVKNDRILKSKVNISSSGIFEPHNRFSILVIKFIKIFRKFLTKSQFDFLISPLRKKVYVGK